MFLVDSNILIDLFTEDPEWAEWSQQVLLSAGSRADLAINPIIYAEVAAAYRTQADLDLALAPLDLVRLELPYAAGFLAAQAFLQYRRMGGERRSPLPDFYIGAHALSAGLTLLTRDPVRYQTYFPQVPRISPS